MKLQHSLASVPSRSLEFGVVAGSAAFAGLLAAARIDGAGPLARPEFAPLLSLPLAIYPVALLLLLGGVLVRRHWWAGLAIFFAWLPFEDLVRKFAANDLRVYFVKDLLLAAALIGITPKLRGTWRRPLGSAWAPTVALLSFAALMSIPAAAIDPALPVLAFQTRFLFIALVPVGVYLALDRNRLESTTLWLSILASAVCSLGLLQSVLGPTFLNPAQSTLSHLSVVKGIGPTEVLRPSGPFTDVSRFASMTIVGVVLGLCAFRLASTTRRRQVSGLSTSICLIAAFASGSRTSFLISLPIVAIGIMSPNRGLQRSRRTGLAIILVLGIIVVAVASSGSKPATQTADFYVSTIDPRSQSFELGSRLRNYVSDARAGVNSGPVGRGTGAETLGAQYLGGGYVATGTESGYGSVGVEWGVLGLGLWLFWSVSWLRRSWRVTNERRGVPSADIGLIIVSFQVAFLFVMFSLGIGFFENYIGNVFFWLLSGMNLASSSAITTTTKSLSVPDVSRSRP